MDGKFTVRDGNGTLALFDSEQAALDYAVEQDGIMQVIYPDNSIADLEPSAGLSFAAVKAKVLKLTQGFASPIRCDREECGRQLIRLVFKDWYEPDTDESVCEDCWTESD